MRAQTLLPIRVATRTRSGISTPHSPVRVFLLSDHRLLRETLARVRRNHAGILLVGAAGFSAAIVVLVTASACDVLLVAPLIVGAFEPSGRFHCSRILAIEMDAGIADLISLIVSVASGEASLGDYRA